MYTCELCGRLVHKRYLLVDKKLGKPYIVCQDCGKPPYEVLKRRYLTKKQKSIIVKAYGYRCAHKKCPQKRKLNIKLLRFHHRTPLTIGGSNELTNYAPLCRWCHKVLTGVLRSNKFSADAIIYVFTMLKPIPVCFKHKKLDKKIKYYTLVN